MESDSQSRQHQLSCKKGYAWTTAHGAQTNTHGRAGESPQGLTRGPQHDGGVGVFQRRTINVNSARPARAKLRVHVDVGLGRSGYGLAPAALYWTQQQQQHVTSATVRARPLITVRVHAQYMDKLRAAVPQKGNGSKLKVNIGFY